MSQISYIVIHGHGGSLADAVNLPRRLISFECYWEDGIFYLPRLISLPLRRLLAEGEDDNKLFNSLRKLALSNMLQASLNPGNPPENIVEMAEFSENSILNNFPSFSIPLGYESRKAAVSRLKQEGEEEFVEIFCGKDKSGNIEKIIQDLEKLIKDQDGSLFTEDFAEESLKKAFKGEDFIETLKELRDMEETGGDLDTVSSSVFYAHALRNIAKKENKTFKYGLDFRFVFINYHEGLRALGELSPGNIYMADLPVSTIPDLPGDLKFLKEKDINLVRYEDHHPYTEKHKVMLDSLVDEGLIEFYAMSGPLLDPEGKESDEEDPEDLKCGGDMVYEALIKGKEWDFPAMQHLRELTHCEDFASDRKPSGKILTELIKGGICKVDLAQTLLSCREKEDILRKLNDKGWYEKVQRKRYEAIEISERFMEHVHVLEIERPETGEESFSGPALDDGSDMPVPRQNREEKQKKIKIVMALAPKTKRGEPKLNVGRACEYFSDKIEGIDYLFFCYGASIVVGRRLNQADFSLNLSTLFRKLGTEKDGGHAGASVCSPENNPDYPKNILGRVSSANFAKFSRYMADRISEELNVKVHSKTDISIQNKKSTLSTGGKKLIYLLIAAILLGLLVILLNKNFRIQKIEKQNKDFFPEAEK